jgi:hypothetical protein
MPNYSQRIHPHARLWIATSIILGLLFVLKTPARELVSPPQGRVIAYYHNDYQRHAIDKLTEQDKLEQYPCLYELWMHESNWRPKALNRHGGAMGIAQLKPNTWRILKIKPTLDGNAQVDAGLLYIDRHYGKSGGVCRAYAHWLAKGWY